MQKKVKNFQDHFHRNTVLLLTIYCKQFRRFLVVRLIVFLKCLDGQIRSPDEFSGCRIQKIILFTVSVWCLKKMGEQKRNLNTQYPFVKGGGRKGRGGDNKITSAKSITNKWDHLSDLSKKTGSSMKSASPKFPENTVPPQALIHKDLHFLKEGVGAGWGIVCFISRRNTHKEWINQLKNWTPFDFSRGISSRSNW